MTTTQNLGLQLIEANGFGARADDIIEENFAALDASIGAAAGAVSPGVQGLLAWTFDPAILTAASSGQAATVILLSKIPIQKSITATNLVVLVAVAGTSYSNAQLGLYSSTGVLLGATAVLASGGTNTFGTTGVKTVALSTPVSLTGGPTTFVWSAVHLGVNNATAVVLNTVPSGTAAINAGTTAATSRFASQAGHATNPLATIGNLTPASNSPANTMTWMAIS